MRFRVVDFMISVLMVAGVVLCFIHPATAASEIRFRINVNISGDPTTENLVRSYANRELRAIGDVDLVDKKSDWLLSIICFQLETKSGYPSGVAVSVVITECYPNAAIVSLLPSEKKQLGDEITSDLNLFKDHWLRAGSKDDLKQICAKVVADFDSLYLEEERHRWRRVQNLRQRNETSK